jgi:hypothetical protein
MRQRTIRRRLERRTGAESAPAKARGISAGLVLGLLLILGTLFIFSAVRSNAFLNYDDDGYVYRNPHVTAGLKWQTVRWAVTTTEAANWHPVTWLSHALDCQLFGLDAGNHHLTSAVIHAFAALLLFLVLWQISGSVGRSFLVAALFACHPFNVQSVAWVAERKNLLSTFFFLLTIGAYAWYVKQPRVGRLAAVIVTFVLALASKPVAVTLPFVLLLLDFWPLQRVGETAEKTSAPFRKQYTVRMLLLEKVPLFVLSAASCVVTVWAQKAGGALRPLQLFPLGARIGNALYSYLLYIVKTVWPHAFAVYYPHPGASLAWWKPVLSIIILAAISFGVFRERAVRPYLLTGWLWFLGTLVPVIGIVQVGDQGMADRYAYLPLIGLFVMIVWGAADLFDSFRINSAQRWAVAAVATAALVFITAHQISYWKDSVSLWSHALQVTGPNLHTEEQLGSALVAAGETSAAMPHLQQAALLNPKDGMLHVNLGFCYMAQNELQNAIQEFLTATKLTQDVNAQNHQFQASAFLDLGIAYTLSKDYAKALASFQQANQSGPARVDNAIANLEQSVTAAPAEVNYLKLSLLLRAKGLDQEASTVLQQAANENPSYIESRALLSYLNASE